MTILIRILTIFSITTLAVTIPYVKADEASMPLQTCQIFIGHASWYSEDDPGINLHTANNELFNDSELTCAIWDVPFNQRIKVTNLQNGRSIVVRVNDRGPHKRFVQKGRVIDLTKNAFSQLGHLKDGLIPVSLQFL